MIPPVIRDALYDVHPGSQHGLGTKKQLAAFLAQVDHESAGFTRLEENLNYSAKRLCAVWPRRFPTLDAAKPYARHPERLANKIYSGRMGNGPEVSGDGYRYRGRGFLQLTGRDNYTRCGADLDKPFVSQPHLVALPAYAVGTAIWFWKTNGCGVLAEREDMPALTKRINGGLNGLEERIKLYQQYFKELG
ncbi:MAG: glycoside hydrolase family 19 protein [Nitrososphaera sp.]|nr:glycoside hydrolase family 19 protein [Nitrososphaera sp.]